MDLTTILFLNSSGFVNTAHFNIATLYIVTMHHNNIISATGLSVECYILQVLHATPRVVLAILSVVNSSQAGRYKDNKRDLGTL